MPYIPISTVVRIVIDRQTRSVTQQGFGIPMILGSTAVAGWNAGEVRTYYSLTAVLDDFSSSDDEYKAAAAIFAQSPSVEYLKIGKRGAAVAQVVTLTTNIDFVASNSITLKVNGDTIGPVAWNTSHNQTTTDLATAIQAHADVVTATVTDGREITITAKTAGYPIDVSNFVVTGGTTQPTALIVTTTPNHGLAEDIADCQEDDDDWYGLIITSRTEEDVLEAAKYIETQRKIFVTCSDDSLILNGTSTTDIAYILSAAGYERTAVIYNADEDDYADAAWMGRCLVYDPGNETWKFKTLSSITYDDLTASERLNALTKNANVYISIGGVSITDNGTMASGEFIDIMRGVDWLTARLEERIYSRLVNLPKIPFTDAGIAIIEAEIRAVLENGVRENLIADDPAYTVTVPKAVDVPFNDRADRYLPDLQFSARLAGAVHKVEVEGVVTV